MKDEIVSWSGYILLHSSELRIIDIRGDAGSDYPNIWLGEDGELLDDIEGDNWREELTSGYGERFYASFADFQSGIWLPLSEVWPE